ncbi:UDP-N-acetylglucosamine transferase subunit [Tulasnella sp. 419]|nr:UDP-N-acetylglucosamine transferase subunit [Tulasnella sp. 419]
MLLFIIFLLSLIVPVRAYAILPRDHQPTKQKRKRSQSETCSLAVFLGSGGHTSEALALVSSLDFSRYTPRKYIISEGDTLSAQKAIELEKQQTSDPYNPNYTILTLPRARRVHQSLLSTPPTFIKSLLAAIWHICIEPNSRGKPFADALLLNGPGTCVSVCAAAYISRFFGLPSPRIMFVESFARVKSLSLSAKILRPLADR